MRLVFGLALVLCACTARTEILIGVITDLHAPGVLDEVQLDVAREGVPLLSNQWLIPGVAGQPYILPGSYGLYDPNGQEAPVAVQVTGFKAGEQIVTRQALVSLVPQETLFMRMALSAGCLTVADCATDQTCVEGLCQAQLVDTRTLPVYRDGIELTIECRSGPLYIDTGAGTPLVPTGECAADEICQEGTCYRPLTAPAALWTTQTLPVSTTPLAAVWVQPGAQMETWAAGAGGRVLHRVYASSAEAVSGWVDASIPGGPNLVLIGVADKAVWAGGGASLYWQPSDGSGSWSPVTLSGVAQPNLRGSAVIGGHLIIVGEDLSLQTGFVMTSNGPGTVGTLTGTPGPPPRFWGIAADPSGTTAFIVGPAGVLQRFNNGELTDLTAQLKTTADLVAVAATTNNAYALTSDGRILTIASTGTLGATWAGTPPMRAIYADDTLGVLAVGDGAGIVRAQPGSSDFGFEDSAADGNLGAVFGGAADATGSSHRYFVADTQGGMLESQR